MQFRVLSIGLNRRAVDLVKRSGAWKCGLSKAPPPVEKADAPPPAEQILQRMVAAYRDARSYSDQAVVRLKYRERGQWFEDQAKFAVSLVRPQQAVVAPTS